MKVSKQRAAENRSRIVTEAARLFREKGLSGIGVDALTKAAGLTHGGLYSHFGSKEHLAAEALAEALKRSVATLYPPDAAAMPGAFETVVARYLSSNHRDTPGSGCAIAAVGCEVGRHGPAVRQALTDGLRDSVSHLSAILPDQTRPEDVKTEEALAALASMVGALILARAVDDPDLSDRILRASQRHIIETATRKA